jgi:hypothetical protein
LSESVDLAHRVLLYPVTTEAGLAEKKRVVEASGLEIESNQGTDFVDDWIYGTDVERIADQMHAASKRRNTRQAVFCPKSCDF